MQVGRVILRVSDVDASARFYERIAGLAIRSSDEQSATLGAPDGGPVRLELRRAARPGVAPRRAAGLFHTALRYPRREALAVALRALAESREPITGAADHGVSEALYLDDPDGLGVELYRDRPREQWPAPHPGERVHIYTAALDLEDLLAAGAGAPALPEAAGGIDVGHVHLKVADVGAAADFWAGAVGLEEMARFGPDAAFLADGGYHHHIGANTWLSRGAALEPAEGPGLDAVVLVVDDLDAARARLEAAGAPLEQHDGALATRTPDGVPVLLETA